MSRLASAQAWRLEVRCRGCGADYAPSRADLLAGPATYRVCPACRRAALDRDAHLLAEARQAFNREKAVLRATGIYRM